MATTGEDLRSSSLETRNTQEGANEVVDETMRLERATALYMMALHDVEAAVLEFNTWSKLEFLRARHGDWSEYIVLVYRGREEHCLF
jgi:hypothetical protein